MDEAERLLIERIRAALAIRKMSMRFVSNQLSLPYRSVQNYLSGQTRMPAVVYCALTDLIGVDNNYIMRDDFTLIHSDMYDAVLKLVKDGAITLSTQLIPATYEQATEETKTKVVASLVAERLSDEYARYRRETMKASIAPGRSPTTAEVRARSANRTQSR